MREYKLLIDTNIFIGLEDSQKLSPDLAELVRKSSEFGVKIFVHEDAIEDILRDKNDSRREISLSKIKRFPKLEGISLPDKASLQKEFGSIKRVNDEVDVALLWALKINSVDFLVTQDTGIHTRANRAGLAKRVFTLDDAISWLRQTLEPKEVKLPLIEEKKAHEIDISDEIFDSLREGYEDFDDWWRNKCVPEHRVCWIASLDGEIAGLVVRKQERWEEANTNHAGPKILKVCTFKVKPKFRGEKLGEQLLKQTLWYAQRNNYDLVYLTTFPEQTFLVEMIEYYGFSHTQTREEGERVYEKTLSQEKLKFDSDDDVFDVIRTSYPRFGLAAARKVLCVPIQDQFHQKLFPEIAAHSPLPLFREPILLASKGSRSPGNTIRKVYLCRAKIRSLSGGDILLFYQSQSEPMIGSQAVTTVGVVEKVSETNSYEEVVRLTAKRSVYSANELSMLIKQSKEPLKVIDFLLVGHLETPLPLKQLKAAGMLKAHPQSITEVGTSDLSPLRSRLKLGFDF